MVQIRAIVITILLGPFFEAYGQQSDELDVLASGSVHSSGDDDRKPVFELAINKLEHLFANETSLFEIEATVDYDNFSIGIRSESAYDAGKYGASENRLYVARSLGRRASGFIGVRYLDWIGGGATSAIIGGQVVTAFDIDVVMSAFLGRHGELEGRLEFERPTMLGPLLELQPKLEVQLFNREVDSLLAEFRLAYLVTDRLQTYIGFSWFRFIGAASEENERTALVGLSLAW